MIRLNDIVVKFGDFTALHDINVHVKEGEFFTFLGPSGCGKTTTLRTITGFIEPVSGTVVVKGKDITPFMLAHIVAETGGDSLKTNIQLAFNNARAIEVYPGEKEQEALALPALKVLRGELKPLTYSGHNVWPGFGDIGL